MDRERLKGHLDLPLLSVLSSGPAHGYAIISAHAALGRAAHGVWPPAAGRAEAERGWSA